MRSRIGLALILCIGFSSPFCSQPSLASPSRPTKFEILNARISRIERMLVSEHNARQEKLIEVKKFNSCRVNCETKYNNKDAPFEDVEYNEQTPQMKAEVKQYWNDQRECRSKCVLPQDELNYGAE